VDQRSKSIRTESGAPATFSVVALKRRIGPVGVCAVSTAANSSNPASLNAKVRLIRIISDRMKPSFMKMSEHFNSWNAKEIAIKSPDRFVIVHSKEFQGSQRGDGCDQNAG